MRISQYENDNLLTTFTCNSITNNNLKKYADIMYK